MASTPSFSTGLPLPLDSGSKILDDSISQVPIHVVSQASQLPPEFMEPSAERPLVIGFDCEGVNLCRHGSLCIMQLGFPDAVYLVDVIQGGVALMEACKAALESSYITKVIHDCKRDSEALFFQFGIKLHNVVDTQIAYSLIEEQEGKKRIPDDYISFVGLVADTRYCGIPYLEKEEIRVLLRKDPMFWTYRPMSDLMVRTAADDDMDWPPTALLPDKLKAEGYFPEEEILSVLSVPTGKMGRVIGKGGSSIRSIKESCSAEIVIGGSRGPPDKVFTIGTISQVRKAEALLRGCMLDL